MARPWSEMLWDFRHYWKNFVWQSLLAACSVFLVLMVLGVDEAVLIASLGATAFVVFALPEKVTAFPRNVIGGHFIGVMCGYAGIAILKCLPEPGNILENAVYAFSVGFSIFLMTVFDTEHPPAAGTTLGVVVMKTYEPQIFVQVMFFAVIFSGIRLLLKKHLHDLTYLPRPPEDKQN